LGRQDAARTGRRGAITSTTNGSDRASLMNAINLSIALGCGRKLALAADAPMNAKANMIAASIG